MPARDGTGPIGSGRGMGRHRGACGNSVDSHGLRLRDGSCRYLYNEKDALIEEKHILESRLELVNRRLDLSD